jgi:hypothetical protein
MWNILKFVGNESHENISIVAGSICRWNLSPSSRFDGSELFIGLKFGVLNVLHKCFFVNLLNHLHDIWCIGT